MFKCSTRDPHPSWTGNGSDTPGITSLLDHGCCCLVRCTVLTNHYRRDPTPPRQTVSPDPMTNRNSLRRRDKRTLRRYQMTWSSCGSSCTECECQKVHSVSVTYTRKSQFVFEDRSCDTTFSPQDVKSGLKELLTYHCKICVIKKQYPRQDTWPPTKCHGDRRSVVYGHRGDFGTSSVYGCL